MRLRWLSVVTAVCLALLLPAAASAQPVLYIYHGTLTYGQLNDCDGAGTITPVLTSGKWTASITPGGMAQIDATEFHDWGDGWVHQMAMGGAEWGKFQVISAAPGSFHMSVFAFDQIQVDAYLSDGQFRVHLEPYAPCGSADVFGVVRWDKGS
jgi:hypothetical protein